MPISVETNHRLRRKIQITIPADHIENMVKKELFKLASKISLDGFRKGKVPLKIIAQRYESSIRHDVLKDLMQNHVRTAINQQKLRPVGQLKYVSNEYQVGQDFTYLVEFEVYPNIEIKEWENFHLEKPLVEITELDVDNMLMTLRQQQESWKKATRAAKAGDRVTIDFISVEDGKNVEKFTDTVLVIGHGLMPLDFETGIIGHQSGETFRVEVRLSENPQADNLQSKLANFSILLKKVEELEITEFNLDWIKNFRPDEGSISEIRNKIRQSLERELKWAVRSYIKLQVFNELLKSNTIDLPVSLIETEIERLRRQNSLYLVNNGNHFLSLPRSFLEENAKKRVAISLLLSEFIRINHIQAEESKIQALLEDLSARYDNPKKVREDFRKNHEITNHFYNLILEDQAINMIINKSIVNETGMSFRDLMGHIKNNRWIEIY
ncbi:MAG: trigger factor [Candidatus Dasytiphilus stammeri]